MGPRLECMRNQKCIIYQDRIVTDDAQREVNETYAAFGMKCPASIPIIDDRLAYTHPALDMLPSEKKKRRKRTSVETKDTETKESVVRRKPGRPKSSKNKKTLEREALEQNPPQEQKRSRRRHKSSKNKKTLVREAIDQKATKLGRGRPKGSPNRKHKNE